MVFQREGVDFQPEVMWDLRQFYTEWIKNYTIDFTIAQRSNLYPKMLEKLRFWHGAIWGRVIKDFDKEWFDDEWDKILKNISNHAQKNKGIYFGTEKNQDAAAKWEMDDLFLKAVIYLVHLERKHKLFGSESVNRGL